MNIEVAGKPERVRIPNVIGEAIRLPLSAEPDELLLVDLQEDDHVRDYSRNVEPDGASLIIYPSRTGWGYPGAMLTAIKARIDLVNNERTQRVRESQEAQKAADERRERCDAALGEWWDQQQ